MGKKKHLFTIVYLLFVTIAFGQSKIEQSKAVLNKKNTETVKSNQNLETTSNTTTSNNSSTNNSILETLFGNAALEVFIYSTYGLVKYGLIGDYQNEDHLKNTLSKSPYFDGIYGNYKDSLQPHHFRLDLESSFMYDNKNMLGNHFKAKIRPLKHFYVKTDFRQLFEKDVAKNIFNQLALYDFSICYDRIRSKRFNLGWTLGLSYIASGVNNGSLSVGVNADYFLKQNISLHGSAQWCSINEFPVNYYELQSKFHKKRGFVSLGYEYLIIGSPSYKFTTVGLGVYF